MKKSYLYSTPKTHNCEAYLLFRFLFIVFFSTSFFNINAQCPIATARAVVSNICSGTAASIELTSTQSGTNYTWTVLQDGVVGADGGTGESIVQTLSTIDAAAGYAVYTIIPDANGCKGASVSVKIKVNPIPLITPTPLSSTVISGDNSSIELTSDAPETSFSWTVIQSSVIGATAGSGSRINQILTTNAEIGIATYRITPILSGCMGESINAKVIVKR